MVSVETRGERAKKEDGFCKEINHLGNSRGNVMPANKTSVWQAGPRTNGSTAHIHAAKALKMEEMSGMGGGGLLAVIKAIQEKRRVSREEPRETKT